MKKKPKSKKKVSPIDRQTRMKLAYKDWLTGKVGSLKQLSKKYRLHVPDISKYISLQFELAKIKKENERTGAKFNS